ncbi:MAG: hypothetical protein HYX53_02000 [Chloroflexi bacterium]|nr:hypothetical protein [Chloroflexota bacterium]
MVHEHAAGSAFIETCQRLEVLHLGSCGCEAPVRVAGAAALLRLAELAAGLHSAVLGERQVFAQVRGALPVAAVPLRRLTAPAIGAARHLRREADLAADSGHLLDLALTAAGATPGGHILVVGTGSVARLVVSRGFALGFASATVAGRQRPDWLDSATCFVPLAELRSAAASAALVLCLSADAPDLAVHDFPRTDLLIDLGTPRRAAPGCTAAVSLAEIGHSVAADPEQSARRGQLRRRLAELLASRTGAAAAGVTPGVQRLREEIERVRAAEVERAVRLRPHLDRVSVEHLTRSLVNQLFHHPTQRLRTSGDPAFVARVTALFDADARHGQEARP